MIKIKKKRLNNYWPTTIIKSNSELFVRVIYRFSNNNLRKKIKYIWLKMFWENYGHFGISKKEDCLLINLDAQRHKKKEVFDDYIIALIDDEFSKFVNVDAVFDFIGPKFTHDGPIFN